jgi:hypothetical protein
MVLPVNIFRRCHVALVVSDSVAGWPFAEDDTAAASADRHDVFGEFKNDQKVQAPFAAQRLKRRWTALGQTGASR